MSQALYRNMRLAELMPFAQAELETLALVTDDTAALTALLEKTEEHAESLTELDQLLESTEFDDAEALQTFVERVQDTLQKRDLDEVMLAGHLDDISELLTEYDCDRVEDLKSELKRLHNLVRGIKDACIEAGIEITF